MRESGIDSFELTPYVKFRDKIHDINDYLENNDISDYIIIDTDDMSNTFGDKIVTVNPHIGLTEEIVNIVIERMKKRY